MEHYIFKNTDFYGADTSSPLDTKFREFAQELDEMVPCKLKEEVTDLIQALFGEVDSEIGKEREDAKEDGKKDGYEDGYSEGKSDGYNEGYEAGKEEFE